MIVIHSNFFSDMHGFRDNEVLLQAGYDVIVIFHGGFWKSDHELLIVFHINFLSGMHGFRQNKVLLQAEYDVIVISPPGGASSDF